MLFFLPSDLLCLTLIHCFNFPETNVIHWDSLRCCLPFEHQTFPHLPPPSKILSTNKCFMIRENYSWTKEGASKLRINTTLPVTPKYGCFGSLYWCHPLHFGAKKLCGFSRQWDRHHSFPSFRLTISQKVEGKDAPAPNKHWFDFKFHFVVTMITLLSSI